METGSVPAAAPSPASLVVVDPGGSRERVPVAPLPFTIGRQPGAGLILRDSRVSRTHARIFAEGEAYVLEDCGSRHGTFVNGKRIERHTLKNSDRIDFGAPDSYHLIFALDGVELKRLMAQVGAAEMAPPPGVGGGLAKLRAILELARTLQSSFTIDEVLTSVVDTALAITGAERGFLLLRAGGKSLEIKVARHAKGHHLRESDLRVPREVIHRALENRRELLSMNFDPLGEGDTMPRNSVADLELRSVICVPLVRIRAGHGDTTSVLSTGNETAGVLYMDSRIAAADLAGGNRELLQTLAIEASTVLENARLLEEEEARSQLEEELRVARNIQQSLLPGSLPDEGWLRASGSSVASYQVGGDYYDVTRVTHSCWAAVVADVSGKGVASALLASLLQGALLTASDTPEALTRRIGRLNRFLLSRTGGEKYATVFFSLIHESGRMVYINAAHPPPIVVRSAGGRAELAANAMPVGMMEDAEYPTAEERLLPGDKVVIYSDGVTEAQNTEGEFFGRGRLRDAIAGAASGDCAVLHAAIQKAVADYTEGAAQSDDITVVVLEFPGGGPPTV
ncbi:MAG: SpoIIE family protein phosphatase [Acidobacteria bacterium]|nr:SpoIIE family protein phosphatase [Acidobacteriota bacterium]